MSCFDIIDEYIDKITELEKYVLVCDKKIRKFSTTSLLIEEKKILEEHMNAYKTLMGVYRDCINNCFKNCDEELKIMKQANTNNYSNKNNEILISSLQNTINTEREKTNAEKKHLEEVVNKCNKSYINDHKGFGMMTASFKKIIDELHTEQINKDDRMRLVFQQYMKKMTEQKREIELLKEEKKKLEEKLFSCKK